MYILSSSSDDSSLKKTKLKVDYLISSKNNKIAVYLISTPLYKGMEYFDYTHPKLSMRHVSAIKTGEELEKDAILNGDVNPIYLKKQVISFCLWGDIPRYTIGSIKNAEIARKYYPDFECWFYIHEPTVPKEIVHGLERMDNVKIILKDDASIKTNLFMAWRFEAIDNEDVEINMSRDVDTRILPREILAVRKWLATEKTFHIMRDSPCHYNKIMGGMFGTRKIKGITWKEEIIKYFNTKPFENDQIFLEDVIYGRVKTDSVIHDEFKKYEGANCENFPIPYDPQFNFIGQYVFEDESRDPYYIDISSNYVNRFIPNRVMTNSIDVFIVHYTKLSERKTKMLNQLRDTCLDGIFKIHWVESYDREKLTEQDVLTNYKYDGTICPRVITIGEVANGMAHSYIIEKCAKEYPCVLVLEDDMILTDNFLSNLLQCLENIPKDWDMIGLGGGVEKNEYTGQKLSIVKSPTDCVPTGCFMLKQAFAKKIVSHHLFKPFVSPIDHNLRFITPYLEPHIYWVQPFISYEGSKTDVYKTSFTTRGF
jgi:GR25 family glycosyltransferase involved in LPS biosynthesis